jgi:hypothetical protein
MARTLTAIVTALWLAPLLGWRIGVLLVAASARSSGTPQITAAERGMGEGLLLLAGGGLAGIAIFVATVALIYSYVPPGSLRFLQVTDAIAIACLITWGFVAEAKISQHEPPVYDGFSATLDIEVRAPKALAESSVNFFAHMIGGYVDNHDLRGPTREEGDYSIAPIQLSIISVHDWSVQVQRVSVQNVYRSYRFELPWRDFPKRSLPWSDWIAPVAIPGQDWAQADDVSIRYRWALTPAGETRVYRP